MVEEHVSCVLEDMHDPRAISPIPVLHVTATTFRWTVMWTQPYALTVLEIQREITVNDVSQAIMVIQPGASPACPASAPH